MTSDGPELERRERVVQEQLCSNAFRPPGHGRGFSLLECLIAMLIMSAGSLGVAALQRVLQANADVTRQRLEAAHLIEQKLEQLRALRPSPPSMPPTPSSLPPATQNADTPSLGGNARFARRWTTTALSTGLDFVRVDVDWTDRFGRQQTLSIRSLAATTDPAEAVRLRLQVATPAAP